jgi:hypothetical protein
MTQNIAEAIIRGEENTLRFEDFCREISQREFGVVLVPTSKTYDLGRDAKSLDSAAGAYVCATIEKNKLQTKIDDDTKHLQATSAPRRVLYCTAVSLSEHLIDKYESLIRANMPQATARVLSAQQLASLAVQHFDIFERYYVSELKATEAMLLRLELPAERSDEDALRLALLTMGTDDARQLRDEIGRHAVLQVLFRAAQPATAERIAETIAADLRIASSVHPNLVEALLDRMRKQLLVEEREGRWTLTDNGRNEAENVPTETAQQVLEGARVIRSTLEELSGYRFTDLQFTTLWSTLLDYLTELFRSKGLAVIHAINDVLSDTTNSSVPLEQIASEGALKIRNSLAIPEMGEVIEQAVVDMLTERKGSAFEWLAKVCERFVALCALGLETKSSEEIRRIIARYRLVLDSDIVITMLCEAERGHRAVREVIGRWQRLGGKVLMAPQVLEEVAYHAYISEREFQELKHLGPELKGVDLRRYCSNAFVRAFFSLETDLNQWPIFRDQYAGSKPHDYSKIVDVLRDELHFDILPSDFDKELGSDITRYLREISSESEQIATKYFGDPGRLGRDGQVLAMIAQSRDASRAGLSDARIILLSSSLRLRRADERFRERLGTPESVISRAAVSYLIALVPEAGLGAASLRRALFEFGETAHFTDTERFSLRIIKSSGTVSMPWAKRTALRRQIETSLRREAERSGLPLKQVKMEFVSGRDPKATAEIIVNAVTELSLRDPERIRLERELGEARKQLAAAAERSTPVQQRARKKRGRRIHH